MSCELWSINRWLRWSGWRLYIEIDGEPDTGRLDGVKRLTLLAFYGWRGLVS